MKYIKYAIFVLVLLFSFFISDKALLWVENLSPIMEEIENVKEKYEVKSVNALIKDNTIIPGEKGKVVNERESYVKMNEFGSFNDSFLVYDFIKPDISLYDNLDKIIIKGRNTKKISILIDNDDLSKILEEEKIEYDFIDDDVKKTRKYAELIGEYKKNKICIVGISNIKKCKQNKKFLVMPNIEITDDTLYKINNIEGGSVVYLKNASASTLRVVLNKIKSKNLDIIKISELIKE